MKIFVVTTNQLYYADKVNNSIREIEEKGNTIVDIKVISRFNNTIQFIIIYKPNNDTEAVA